MTVFVRKESLSAESRISAMYSTLLVQRLSEELQHPIGSGLCSSDDDRRYLRLLFFNLHRRSAVGYVASSQGCQERREIILSCPIKSRKTYRIFSKLGYSLPNTEASAFFAPVLSAKYISVLLFTRKERIFDMLIPILSM